MSLLAATVPPDALAQALQIVGALCVLVGFAAAQTGALSTRSPPYLLLNLAGSGLLAALAAADGQYGFLLLEAAWALVTAWSLARRLTRRTEVQRAPAHARDGR